MNAQLQHMTYTCGGAQNSAEGLEQCLRLGPCDAAHRVLILLPLFDEMNRTRRTILQTMRALDGHGVATYMPDLPGCNESMSPLAEQDIASWRSAAARAADTFGATHILSLRGGCLLDDGPGLPVLRIAPVKGASLIKTLVRTQIASDKEAGITSSSDGLAQTALSGTVLLAGNIISGQLWADMDSAVPANQDNITELALPDIHGSALWLRAEPRYDARMADALAHAVNAWCRQASGGLL